MFDCIIDRFLSDAIKVKRHAGLHINCPARLELALETVQALHLKREVLERGFQTARLELYRAKAAGERARLSDCLLNQ